MRIGCFKFVFVIGFFKYLSRVSYLLGVVLESRGFKTRSKRFFDLAGFIVCYVIIAWDKGLIDDNYGFR